VGINGNKTESIPDPNTQVVDQIWQLFESGQIFQKI